MRRHLRRWLAYRLFTIAGRLLPDDERARLLRVLRTGDPEERDAELPVTMTSVSSAE